MRGHWVTLALVTACGGVDGIELFGATPGREAGPGWTGSGGRTTGHLARSGGALPVGGAQTTDGGWIQDSDPSTSDSDALGGKQDDDAGAADASGGASGDSSTSGGMVGAGGGCDAPLKLCPFTFECQPRTPEFGCSQSHCNNCGPPPTNATRVCRNGACAFDCMPGYELNIAKDGCDVDPGAGGSGSTGGAGGVTHYWPCSDDAYDCDGNAANGCETPVSDQNCGGCLRTCNPVNTSCEYLGDDPGDQLSGWWCVLDQG